MSSGRNLLGVAVVVAFLAGLLRGFQALLPAYLASSGGLPVESLGTVLTAIALLLLVIDPFVVSVLGYLWGRRTSVPSSYIEFGGRLFVTALVGFVIGYAAISLSLQDPEGSLVVRAATVSSVTGVETAANVALAAMAASALAHFRGRFRPGPA